MPYRVAIGPSTFAEEDKTPLAILEKSGFEIIPNPYKRRLTEDEIIDHLKGAEGLIAGLEPLNRKVLTSATTLNAIARVGIGMENIDFECAKELNIKVSNTPEGPTEAVAEMCLTALLGSLRKLFIFNTQMHNGLWKKHIGSGIKGLKILIVGYGRIGQRFAENLRFFGAHVLVADPYIDDAVLDNSVKKVRLEDGLVRADVVSLHASGKSVILGDDQFKLMRKGVVLLNSARGELIDENALIKALDNGIVGSAWFDTFSEEPYNGSLLNYSQVLLTPHVSTYTIQCRRSMEEEAVLNLLRDLGVKAG